MSDDKYFDNDHPSRHDRGMDRGMDMEDRDGDDRGLVGRLDQRAAAELEDSAYAATAAGVDVAAENEDMPGAPLK